MVLEKNKLYEIFMLIKSENMYKLYKNKLATVLRLAEKQYYNDQLKSEKE